MLALIACVLYITTTAQKNYKFQYWFDEQFDNHVNDTFNGSTLRSVIDVSQLNSGFHTLYLHVQDSSGIWSIPRSYLFYRFKNANDTNTLKYCCWYDQNRNTQLIGDIGDGHLLLDVSSLEEGFHTLSMQIGTGYSSRLQSVLFYRFKNANDTNTLKYCCWYDQNHNTQLMGDIGDGYLLLDVSGLEGGFHTLNMQIGTGYSSRLISNCFYIYKEPQMRRYEYWLNGMDSLKRIVDLEQTQDTLRVISLLPVDTLPIRSSLFHFEPNNGNPIICAKNDITFRFFTTEGRHLEKVSYYVDYNVIDTVFADTLERDTTKVIVAPTNNNIHWFKLYAGVGDSLSFCTNKTCTMQLFAPSGTEVFSVSGHGALAWDGCHAWEKGVYYLAIHDADCDGDIEVSYNWIYKYAILAWDVHRVGNGGVSSIIFQGNGFNNLDTVYLVKGRDTLPALYIGHESNTTTSIFFNFENADTGVYNGVFVYKDETLYKNYIIAVETAVPIVLVSNVSYPSTFLRGNTITYTFEITNTGNMTAYNVPLQIYIGSPTFAGISHLELKGLQLKKLYKYINNFDSLSKGDQQAWIDYSEQVGELHYFLPHKNEVNGDSVAIWFGYFFTNISPYETKILSLNLTTTDSVEVWLSMPDEWASLKDTAGQSASVFIRRNLEMQSGAFKGPGHFCCWHDSFEIWATRTSQTASVVGLATLLMPELTITKVISMGSMTVSIGATFLSFASQIAARSVCQGKYGNVRLLGWNGAGLSLAGLTFSAISGLTGGYANLALKSVSAVTGFSSILTGLPGTVDNLANRESVRKSPECAPNLPQGGKSTPLKPVDPNEITGYIAESGSLAVGAEMEQLYYTIEFENDTNFATAHANTVVVRDTLDGNVFDLNSFSSTAFSIGKDITNINGLQGFTRTVDMRPAINTLAQVELNYTIDSGFAVATWTFSSLDPMTLQPVTVDSLGFLRIGGTGEVDFLIRRKANLPDSTLINNRAYIVFDNEAPIATSIWRNIVDNTPPVCVIDSVIYSDVANVHISAKDNLSGVWRYNVYGQDSVWHKLAENIPIDSVAELDTFINQYSVLRAIAIDSAGNMELLPVAPDTTTYQVLLLVDTTQGYVAGGGRFRLLDTAIISATAKHGFHFSHWNDGDTNNPRVVTVAQDTSFTALFDCIPLHASDSITVCDSYSWHGKVYTASTVLTDTLSAINGCDSMVTHNVVIHHAIHLAKTDTACETYTWNDKVYTTSGNFTYKHLDGNGCTQVDTLHLMVHHPIHVAKTDTACETYTWNGKVYTTSGDYTYKHLDGNGCTQVDTLHLTIHNPVHMAKTDTACATYTWNGKAYTVSGDYTYKHLDSNGCTQVDTLHLTVHHPVHVAKTDTACETYTWNGKVYTSSGDYTYKHLDANGCTQVDTLHLTVHYPVHLAKTDTACETYSWNGKVYTTSGDYTYKHLDANGCTQVDTLHLTVNHPVHVAKTDTACETYTWNGKVYTTSGDYTHKHLDANGCTQVDTLHLTIHNPVHVAKTDTSCETYTWNGKAYTVSGDYTYKHLDANGCTQVDTLHLTVNHPIHVAKTDTACETYTWNGKAYNASGDYTYKHLDSNGCTQVDTLHLTVNHPIHVAKTDTACETYTWNGKVYTTSGDYTYRHLDANGCTQVDTLHLTVNHPIHVAKTDTACETYTWNGKVYTTSGDYTYKHLDANGCTQVDTLHLTVNHPIHVAKTDTACETYTWNGKVYTTSGDYTYKHLDGNGCTQVDTLHLTIHNPVHVAKTDTACETYTWNGKVYTTSGDYTYKHLDGNGCTQVDTLHLTVHHPAHVSKTDTACETYTWNGKVYTSSGDYTYKHLDANGCTQVDTLHLTVHYPVHLAKTDTACETYSWNGKVYTTSGDYTYKHLDANGCTQVDTLHLTVNHPVHVAKIDTACETYTWNGKAYTVSGVYTYKHLDSNGCTQVDTLHLTVNHPVHVAKTDTACETYTWNGKVYTASGDYTYKHLDGNGCTQVDTLHLTVHHPVHVAKTDTACETYTWNGKVYTASGDYTYKHLDANGCTQVDTLHLTVHNPVHVAKTGTACETYTWNGKVYTTSGDYTYKHLDANGCTQVDTLHLTVNNPVHVAKTDTACETYTWNGKVYTTSGDYTYKHLDANGCTQVDTLHLTVNHPIHVAKTDTACETYTWNGQVYTTSGIYTYKHLDSNGCTQVDTLHLTVNYNSVRNDTVEVCDRYTWHDSTYTESGVHQWHGFTVAGCDSTITLHLTINYSADTTVADTADNSYTWHDSTYTESGTYQWKGSTVAGCDSTVTLLLVIRHVGIEVIDGNCKKVKVYPNPTDGWLTIDADNIISIEVYDNTGRRVAEYGATNRIDLSHLPMGGYILKIRMEKGSSIHHVIRN